MAKVDSFKKRHLISGGNDVLIENGEPLIRQLQKEITFLREQFKSTSTSLLTTATSETW